MGDSRPQPGNTDAERLLAGERRAGLPTTREGHRDTSARLLASVDRAKRWDEEAARRWRNASAEERACEVTRLLLLAEATRRGRITNAQPEPLTFPGLPR